MDNDLYNFGGVESLLEVDLVDMGDSNSFLTVSETLKRVGVPKKKGVPENEKPKLIQSCHLLQKKGKYYIVHFKELYALDGKGAEITFEDIDRRNYIASLLERWNLVQIVNNDYRVDIENQDVFLKVIRASEKSAWQLSAKYFMRFEKERN